MNGHVNHVWHVESEEDHYDWEWDEWQYYDEEGEGEHQVWSIEEEWYDDGEGEDEAWNEEETYINSVYVGAITVPSGCHAAIDTGATITAWPRSMLPPGAVPLAGTNPRAKSANGSDIGYHGDGYIVVAGGVLRAKILDVSLPLISGFELRKIARIVIDDEVSCITNRTTGESIPLEVRNRMFWLRSPLSISFDSQLAEQVAAVESFDPFNIDLSPDVNTSSSSTSTGDDTATGRTTTSHDHEMSP
jgi:hypothetical protein